MTPVLKMLIPYQMRKAWVGLKPNVRKAAFNVHLIRILMGKFLCYTKQDKLTYCQPQLLSVAVCRPHCSTSLALLCWLGWSYIWRHGDGTWGRDMWMICWVPSVGVGVGGSEPPEYSRRNGSIAHKSKEAKPFPFFNCENTI